MSKYVYVKYIESKQRQSLTCVLSSQLGRFRANETPKQCRHQFSCLFAHEQNSIYEAADCVLLPTSSALHQFAPNAASVAALPFVMSVPGPIRDFVDSFYAASDVGPSGHQDYIDHFLPESVLVMGPTEYDGHQGIMRFRETAWEKVARRKHIVKGTFINPDNDKEVMLYGLVNYAMKDGSTKDGVEWAARMVLADASSGKLGLQFYQVYIVCGSHLCDARFKAYRLCTRPKGRQSLGDA